MKWLIQYLQTIKPGKAILWCYFIWYGITVFFYFDPSPKIWVNSAGISAVVGTGLLLSVSSAKRDHWQTFRLYLMPFCVSSFSALIKDQGFVVFISPNIYEMLVSVLGCVSFLGIVLIVKSRCR
ncbi:MAG: hypothetical protein EA367_05905 [Leptolyngbya sp. DLM2.Bin15]|nr:MAG: hypothetical protein EA367_05905 [Leptolyngbya sp. DLM2.Bin15]